MRGLNGGAVGDASPAPAAELLPSALFAVVAVLVVEEVCGRKTARIRDQACYGSVFAGRKNVTLTCLSFRVDVRG